MLLGDSCTLKLPDSSYSWILQCLHIQSQNRQGEVKNSIGNVEAKELICTMHGHELRGGNVGGRWGTGQRGIKGENGTTVIA